MICQEWQDSQEKPVSDAQMCRLLNDSKEAHEDPVFEKRLEKLKDGRAQVKGYETRALMVATDEECDRYR